MRRVFVRSSDISFDFKNFIVEHLEEFTQLLILAFDLDQLVVLHVVYRRHFVLRDDLVYLLGNRKEFLDFISDFLIVRSAAVLHEAQRSPNVHVHLLDKLAHLALRLFEFVRVCLDAISDVYNEFICLQNGAEESDSLPKRKAARVQSRLRGD